MELARLRDCLASDVGFQNLGLQRRELLGFACKSSHGRHLAAVLRPWISVCSRTSSPIRLSSLVNSDLNLRLQRTPPKLPQILAHQYQVSRERVRGKMYILV